MRGIKNKLAAFAIVAAVALSTAVAASAKSHERAPAERQVSEKIRKELVTLPYYGVFDNLAYKVEGGTATLYGQVVRPTTRADAERRVAKIEGVKRVVNNIEVLPLSSFDDSIRVRTYRAVFGSTGLYRYAMGSNPSIRIIVDRGHLTLEGVVGNKMDKQLAYMAARGVTGAFSVTNNLQVEGDELPAR